MTPSRQVTRARERANDYWGEPNRYGVARPAPGAGKTLRQLRRPDAALGDPKACSRVIARRSERKRLAPRPARLPLGERHAWQRKAIAFAALRKLLGQDQ